MVETGGLENRCTGNRTGGSNPSPSATRSIGAKVLSQLHWTAARPSRAPSESMPPVASDPGLLEEILHLR